MAKTEPLEVSIIASISGLLDGLGQATTGVKDAARQMEGSFAGLNKTIDNLKAPFLALSAIVAGGAIFKGVMDKTVEWNSGVGKMAKSLGITAGEASVLKVALHTLGIDQDVYTSTAMRMVKQINAGGKGFETLGLSTKDAQGNLKPMPQLMEEAITKINGMKQGTDQMAAAQLLWGKGAAESMSLLKLTAGRMAEARKEAEELHLIVGPEGVAKTREYQESMRKLELIQQSLQIQTGNALMPVLTGLGAWLGKTGPSMAEGFATALKGIISAFMTLKFIIEVIATVVAAFVLDLADGIGTAATAVWKAVHGDFKGAAAEMEAGAKRSKAQWTAAADGIKEKWEELGDGLTKMWDEKPQADGKVGGGGTDTVDPDKDKDTSMEQVAVFKLQLEKKKDAEENWFNWSVEKELAFWSEKLQHVTQGSKAYLAILTEENKLRRKLAEENQAKAKADSELHMAKAREGSQERVDLAVKEADRLKAVYGGDSKQYLEALKKVEQEQLKHAEKMKELNNLIAQGKRDAAVAAMDAELEIMQFEEANGLISKGKLLAAEASFENKKFAIKMAEAKAESALEPDPGKRQQKLNQMEALERQHTAKMVQINQQSALAVQHRWESVLDRFTAGWADGIQKVMHCQMSLRQGMAGAMRGIEDQIEKSLINMGLQWLKYFIMQELIGKNAHMKQNMIDAKDAGAGAYKAVVGIPYVGPVLAPIAAAAAFAGTVAFASGGWERVPSDQMAMVHKNEQILPASYAEGLRNLVAAGGQGGGGGEVHNHSYNIVANDAPSFIQMMNQPGHKAAFVSYMGGLMRNGRIG